MTATSVRPSTQTAFDNLRLTDIVKTLPKECFVKSPGKAWTALIINVLLVALGYVSIAVSPWFLLPIAWIFTGTALTGFFVIGHDCGHRSFSDRRWVNDLVGHIMFAPLIYPFHGWRLGHDLHHRFTNKMDVDNAWQPLRPEEYANLPGWLQLGYQAMRGKLWWLASIAHWAVVHFDPNRFEPRDRKDIKFSVLVVVLAAAIMFPALILTTGISGLVKFWLVPWLVYHFWMSTFTLVHHTVPEIDFQEPDQWNAARAQLTGTVHCDYPAWVEFLCHDINVHVPHHISTAIPHYNLRMAHESLRQNWGAHLTEKTFSWALMRQITEECHLYHPETNYQTFQQFNSQR